MVLIVDVVNSVLQNFYPIEMIYMMLKRGKLSSLWLLFEALTTIGEEDYGTMLIVWSKYYGALRYSVKIA